MSEQDKKETGVVKSDVQGAAVAKKTPMQGLSEWLCSDVMRGKLAQGISKGVTAERLVRVVMQAVSRNPQLLDCTRESLFSAVSCCAQVGLEPNLLGDAYLVPYRNRKVSPERMEAQFIPGYKGLVKLVRRSGELSSVSAEVVYEGDEFSYELGDCPKITHRRTDATDYGKPIRYAYAVANLRDGGIQRCVMTKAQVDRVRDGSAAGKFGPWKDHYDEMAKKTALRALCKLLPLTIEAVDALERDAEMEREVMADGTSVSPLRPKSSTSLLAPVPAGQESGDGAAGGQDGGTAETQDGWKTETEVL